MEYVASFSRGWKSSRTFMKVKDGKETITSKIAYIAGFFDGEGCVRIKESNRGGNSYYVIAHITNTNRRILEQIQDLFGGAIRTQEKGTNKTIYNLCISSAEAVDFLKTLSPFLQEKLEQALLAIKFHEQKATMQLEEKMSWARVMSEMKKHQDPLTVGNIHENPELLP